MFGIGPSHDPVTWCKITHAGEQVAMCDFQNNATRTSPPGPAFVLAVPLRTCSPVCVILYHVTGSCKELIATVPINPMLTIFPTMGHNRLLNPGETILCQTPWETTDKYLDL